MEQGQKVNNAQNVETKIILFIRMDALVANPADTQNVVKIYLL
jgi:hypothetical protein